MNVKVPNQFFCALNYDLSAPLLGELYRLVSWKDSNPFNLLHY